MLLIRNKNSFEHRDRFNGQEYVFPTGETVQVPEDAANHFFGYGDGNKIPYMTRAGWMRHSGDFDRAKQILNNFVFQQSETIIRPIALIEESENGIDTPQEQEGQALHLREEEIPSFIEAPVAHKKKPRNALSKLAQINE